LKNAQGIFYTNIWTFKVLKRFFKIWVGSTVFTVTVLCSEKYPQNARSGKPDTINFNNKNEFLKIFHTSADD
jgi:hypothetical protein